jgi:tetratricopeptide (TPR) repeat protein
MKTFNTFLLSAVFSLASVVCRAGDEKTAIQATIDNELKAYLDGNFDEWSSYWIQEPFISQNYSGSFQYSVIKSFASLAENVRKSIDQKIQAGQKIEKKVTDFKIIDPIALVNVDESFTFDYYGEERKWMGKSLYILKKVDGEWKFVSQNCVLVSTYESNDINAENYINISGYMLLQLKKTDDAIKVFKLNTELYPGSFNVWDSLAEAYMIKGENDEAEKYYKKSLELNPDNSNALNQLKKLEKK